jgi:hypothetical protein
VHLVIMRVGVITQPKKAAQQQAASRHRLQQVVKRLPRQRPHPPLRNFAQA